MTRFTVIQPLHVKPNKYCFNFLKNNMPISIFSFPRVSQTKHFYFFEQTIKGYLHYKRIISKNVSSQTQVKNFFISQKSYLWFSRYSSSCISNHSMIYQICDVMMSILHETGCIFEYTF